MKKGSLLILTCLLLRLFSSCTLFDKKNTHAESTRVLNESPFKSLTDSIKRFPEEGSLYFKRAELLSRKNFHELANDDFQKAWEMEPDESIALAYTANLFMSGKEEKALVLLQQCVKKFPANSEFPRRLSEAYLQSGNTTEALELYNHILEADPGNFETWYEKGLLYARLKDTAQAIAALEKAYALQPIQLFALTLGNLYAETRNSKVIPLCDQLLQKDSAQELTDPLFLKGVYFSNTGEQAKAIEQFENCIRRDWKFTEAYIEKGIILYSQKNYDEALRTFALAAKVSNSDADAYYWMGRCYESIGNKEEARDHYEHALALDMDLDEAREGLQRVTP